VALEKAQCRELIEVGVKNIKNDLNNTLGIYKENKKPDDSKHVLLDRITDSTKFYLARSPN